MLRRRSGDSPERRLGSTRNLRFVHLERISPSPLRSEYEEVDCTADLGKLGYRFKNSARSSVIGLKPRFPFIRIVYPDNGDVITFFVF